jgi:sulfur carrier protein ThiS
LEKDLDLERRMKIAGENKKIATRKTTIPILIDVGGFDIEDSAIQKNNSIIPNNRTKSQKSLIDWL